MITLTPAGGLQPLWEARGVTSLRSQWRWFQEQAPGELILMQVGKRLEAYDGGALDLVAVTGERLDPVARIGFAASAGVGLGRVAELCRRVRRAKLAYRLVVEEGYLRRGMRRRVVREWWIPLGSDSGS